MDIEETTFKIASSIPFVCDECKKHEAMITELRKGNEALKCMRQPHKMVEHYQAIFTTIVCKKIVLSKFIKVPWST